MQSDRPDFRTFRKENNGFIPLQAAPRGLIWTEVYKEFGVIDDIFLRGLIKRSGEHSDAHG